MNKEPGGRLLDGCYEVNWALEGLETATSCQMQPLRVACGVGAFRPEFPQLWAMTHMKDDIAALLEEIPMSLFRQW